MRTFQPTISTFYAYQETYLDSSISSSDNNFTIPGYDQYTSDYPSNVKREESGWGGYLL